MLVLALMREARTNTLASEGVITIGCCLGGEIALPSSLSKSSDVACVSGRSVFWAGKSAGLSAVLLFAMTTFPAR